MWRNYLKERQVQVEAYMQTLAPAQPGPLSRMMESMRYSLFAGGKRLRPILLLAAVDTVGGDGRQFLHSACALEMIHTYSLIHDDLPAMDDDDYRRGRLTNHKVFGDGMAVLAGDGLLTMAFETLLSQPGVTPEIRTRVALEVAQAAGPFGMVGGQAIDLDSEGQQPTPEIMTLMHQLKTGALFRASLRAGALLAGGSAEAVQKLTEYAEQFGLAFQITDDILDVTGTEAVLGKPIGSDEKNHKATYVSMYSLSEAQTMAKEAVGRSIRALEEFGDKAWVLRSLAEYLLTRDS
ncbi:MAG: polyprenyl synthetase family protein [Negativicutes bacterium]